MKDCGCQSTDFGGDINSGDGLDAELVIWCVGLANVALLLLDILWKEDWMFILILGGPVLLESSSEVFLGIALPVLIEYFGCADECFVVSWVLGCVGVITESNAAFLLSFLTREGEGDGMTQCHV
jgi:hypothetical protein